MVARHSIWFLLFSVACSGGSAPDDDSSEGALTESCEAPTSLAGLELGISAVKGADAVAIQRAIAARAKKREDIPGATYVGLMSVGPDGEPAVFGIQCVDGEMIFGGRPSSDPESIACALATVVRGRVTAPVATEGEVAKLVHEALGGDGERRSAGPLACSPSAGGHRCELRGGETASIRLDDPSERKRMPEAEALAMAKKTLPTTCAR